MIPTQRIRSPIAALVAITFLIAGFTLLLMRAASTTSPSPNEVVVAATIFPLADIAVNIAGENASVIQLIPGGASPHSYNFTPQDIGSLRQTRLLFAIGHGLDDWSAKPAAESVGVPLIVVDKDVSLRKFEGSHEHEDEADHESETDNLDPHYWLTTPNAKIIATNIANQLRTIDPEHAEAYTDNLNSYIEKLDSLEEELQQQASEAKQKHFIAMHDAWSYFADHYGFDLAATYEPVEGRQPSIADLQHIQEVIQEHDITAFYAEPQKQSSAATRFLAEEFNLSIEVLDPEGGVENTRKSYIDLMRYNIDQLTKQ